jgi:hypothetical protein
MIPFPTLQMRGKVLRGIVLGQIQGEFAELSDKQWRQEPILG